MNKARRSIRLIAAPILVAGLSGCVAAAIPVLAGGVLVDSRKRQTETAAPMATPSPEVTVEAAASPAGLPAALASPGLGDAASADAPPVRSAGEGFAAFARYAIAKAPPAPPGEPRLSALLDQASIGAEPRRLACGDQPPAVVIDLDPAGGAFDPDDPPSPAAGLAAELAAVRAAGVTVMWAANVAVSESDKVYTVLQATALDPDRTDRLLLLRRGDERKQERRSAAARDWCVIAIAGDARGDFDELYDYLVDPSGSVAEALAPNFGAGWFLVPPPIE